VKVVDSKALSIQQEVVEVLKRDFLKAKEDLDLASERFAGARKEFKKGIRDLALLVGIPLEDRGEGLYENILLYFSPRSAETSDEPVINTAGGAF